MKKSKIFSLLLCVVLGAAVLCGCGSSSSSDKDTFTYVFQSDTGNVLNYITADSREAMTLAKTVNEPMFTINADGSYNWYVAESFDTEDGLTYTAKIKSDLKWSDDEPLTADDVEWTFNAYMAQDESGALKVSGKDIEVKKVDDTTVTFTLPSPVASIPETISAVHVLPKHVFEGKDNFDFDMTKDTVVGCGPYMVSEYKTGEYVKCVKNPNYVAEEANIENVVFRVIGDSETAKAAVQNGEADGWVFLANELDGMDDFTVTPYSEGRVAYTRINRVSDKMQDKSYREGILKALNREEIMTAGYTSPDYFTLSYSFLPNNNAFYSEDVEKYEQDVDAAKKLVKGGATDLKICYIGDDEVQTAMAQVIQSELKEIGINLELCGVSQEAYMDAAYDCENKDYDMYLGGYIMTIDPDGFKGMFGTGQMINYASDELDKLFEEGMVETDTEKRKEIYNQAQKVVADEALFYPFGTNLRILVTNPSVDGLDGNLVPIVTFEDMGKLSFK